jgi:hypothetical protein
MISKFSDVGVQFEAQLHNYDVHIPFVPDTVAKCRRRAVIGIMCFVLRVLLWTLVD